MSTDIVGPANAPNAVTARPMDTRSFGATDTWVKDCSSPTTNDGTKVQAGFVNALIGQLRSLIRGNGLTVASAPIVAEDNLDTMALKAIQYLIQRGQPLYADDTGTANTVVVALSPAAPEYKKGMVVITKIANDNTGASFINVNGLGNKTITHWDGSALGQFDLKNGALAAFAYDGTNFQLAWSQRQPGAPIFLQASATYFVGGTGASDSNDGLASTVTGGHGPFATLQKAINTIALFNLNGFNVTVNVADGTYTGGAILLPVSGSGSILFVGNTTTPANCLISTTSRSAIIAGNCGSAYSFNGFKVAAVGSSAGDAICGVNANGPGVALTLLNMNYGACVGAHISSQTGSNVFLGGVHTLSGGCGGNALEPGCHIFVNQGGTVGVSGVTPPSLLTGAGFTFAGAFVEASYLGGTSVIYSSISGANCTCQKYNVSGNAVINTFGSGVNYYPGTSSGAAGSGGQYI
jgi:hypothetical protein